MRLFNRTKQQVSCCCCEKMTLEGLKGWWIYYQAVYQKTKLKIWSFPGLKSGEKKHFTVLQDVNGIRLLLSITIGFFIELWGKSLPYVEEILRICERTCLLEILRELKAFYHLRVESKDVWSRVRRRNSIRTIGVLLDHNWRRRFVYVIELANHFSDRYWE